MDEFDPYHKWLGIAKKFRPPTHYHLLGIDPDETDREVIEEAALSRSAHLRGYQVGPHAALCTRLLNEIAVARLTLLNPSKRAAYDATLAPKAAAAAFSARAPRATAADHGASEEFAFEAGSPKNARSPRSGRSKRPEIEIRMPTGRRDRGSLMPVFLIAGAVVVGLLLLGVGSLGYLWFAAVRVPQAPVMVQAVAVPEPPPPKQIEQPAPAPIAGPRIVPNPRPQPAPAPPVDAPQEQIFSRKLKSPKKVQFLPKGDKTSASSTALVVAHEQGLDLVSIPDGVIQAHLFVKQGQGRVKSFDIAADGKTLAYIVDGDKQVHLVDLESRKPTGVCKGAQRVPRTILFSPNGKLLIATEDMSEFVRDKDPGIRVWNALTREQVAEEKIPTNQVYGVAAFSPDGSRYYAASYMGNELRSYDVTPFRLRQARKTPSPSAIVVSKAVPWALVPENFRFKRTVLGDAAVGALDKNPALSLRSAVFSADGKHLVVGGAKVHVFSLPDLVETGTHETFGTVKCVDLSQDGRFLALTCADNTVRVFPGPNAKDH
ncbi:MAG TPA: WD40 repeat domain-containing protein [Gemmataceae bacterium]|jgi:hypothetical protein|nr:WD40 repeat domain-containing protein [Gemmataceae bacterium]